MTDRRTAITELLACGLLLLAGTILAAVRSQPWLNISVLALASGVNLGAAGQLAWSRRTPGRH